MKKTILIIVAACLFSSAGITKAFTGNDLYPELETRQLFSSGILNDYALCLISGHALGYVGGVYDWVIMESGLICPAGNITYNQVADIAYKYLKEHPESRQYNASILVTAALIQAFPCAKK